MALDGMALQPSYWIDRRTAVNGISNFARWTSGTTSTCLGTALVRNWHSAIIASHESESFSEELRGCGAPTDFVSPLDGKNEDPQEPSFRCHMAVAVGLDAAE